MCSQPADGGRACVGKTALRVRGGSDRRPHPLPAPGRGTPAEHAGCVSKYSRVHVPVLEAAALRGTVEVPLPPSHHPNIKKLNERNETEPGLLNKKESRVVHTWEHPPLTQVPEG